METYNCWICKDTEKQYVYAGVRLLNGKSVDDFKAIPCTACQMGTGPNGLTAADL